MNDSAKDALLRKNSATIRKKMVQIFIQYTEQEVILALMDQVYTELCAFEREDGLDIVKQLYANVALNKPKLDRGKEVMEMHQLFKAWEEEIKKREGLNNE